GESNCHLQEWFQSSGDTISKVIGRIVNMLVGKAFYAKYVKLPPDTTPPKILNNPKFYPFLDGSHFDAFVAEE
ncbi:hypothetical protein NEOLEDRAFT_1031836, partial [Neolentinus lepideus HHB14362 ss-1]